MSSNKIEQDAGAPSARNLLRTAAVVLLVLVAVSPIAAQFMVDVRVQAVTDGDTVRVRAGDAVFRVRLHGIDAPERNQPWGIESRDELIRLLGFDADEAEADGDAAPAVTLEVTDIDNWGRMVARIRIGAVDVNEIMLARGMAWHYTEYDDSPEYAAAEAHARGEGRGLWSDADPVAPWDWRRR